MHMHTVSLRRSFRSFRKIVGKIQLLWQNNDWWWDFGHPLWPRNKPLKSQVKKSRVSETEKSINTKAMVKAVVICFSDVISIMNLFVQNYLQVMEHLWQCICQERPNEHFWWGTVSQVTNNHCCTTHFTCPDLALCEFLMFQKIKASWKGLVLNHFKVFRTMWWQYW